MGIDEVVRGQGFERGAILLADRRIDQLIGRFERRGG